MKARRRGVEGVAMAASSGAGGESLGVALRAVPPPPAEALPSAKQLAWLMVRVEAELTAREREFLDRIRQDATVKRVEGLARQFAAIVRGRLVDDLAGWLAASQSSGIRVVEMFAAGLARDIGAVRAALEEPWSNGQTGVRSRG